MYPAVHARTHPDRIAFAVHGGARQTYAQLEDRSARLAGVLHALGVRRGDTLVLATENRIEWSELLWAGWRSGLYVAPLNWHLRPNELQSLLADAQPKAIIASPELKEKLGDVDVPVLVLGTPEYEQALAQATPIAVDNERVGARMVYSSGTTGRPKAIRLALNDVHPAQATPRLKNLFERMGVGPDSVMLSPGPLYHAAPYTFPQELQMLGGTVIVTERFDALETLRAIEEFKVTHLLAVPIFLIRMLRVPEYWKSQCDLSSLETVIVGAAPCPVHVHEAMEAWLGPIVHEYYGASEGVGQTHMSPAERRERPGSVGRSVGGPIRIEDDDGRVLATGERGRVLFERGGAGDLGYLDDAGYLYLVGREAHMIISGGVNIFPQEIEDRLAQHPAVADAAVVGIPDAEFGESVHAVVVLRDRVTRDELIAYCREHLAAFKCPRSVEFVKVLPRSAAGKVLKGEILRRFPASS